MHEGSICIENYAGNILLTATHSMISTYFGSMTMVLKFPLTKAASTKGLQRYKGFGTTWGAGDGIFGLGSESSVGEKGAG